MGAYVELASWMAQRRHRQNTLSGKWQQFVHSVPLSGPGGRNTYFDGFHAGVTSTIDVLSKLKWQDSPILDLQLAELRDELLELSEREFRQLSGEED